MDTSLLMQGVELMLVGMGTVFVFLTVLVGATTLMSTLVMRYQPSTVEATDEPRPEEIAAISAAITAYRNRGPKS